jgi:hypothetical protein
MPAAQQPPKPPPPPAGQAAPKSLTLKYIDRPEVSETFADVIHSVQLDGQVLRIELCVTRLDHPVNPKEPATARCYPVSRLVLSAPAAIDLINRMQQIGAALVQAGVLKQAQPPAAAN